MSKYDIPTLETQCPACAAASSHRVIFANDRVRHMRCEDCDAIHVCPMKGSFQSALHPKSPEEIIATAAVDPEAYSIRSDFHPGDLFTHPKFGTGYVLNILSPPQKMEVLFNDRMRVLVCGPGSGVREPDPEEEVVDAGSVEEGQEISEPITEQPLLADEPNT